MATPSRTGSSPPWQGSVTTPPDRADSPPHVVAVTAGDSLEGVVAG
ncbi:MAG: hypothetical protein H7836_15065 [Magnetococcus sp. YQC-3]